MIFFHAITHTPSNVYLTVKHNKKIDPVLVCNIVKACKKGDTKAFEALVDVYSPVLYSYFYCLTKSSHQSEDLLSDVYLKTVRNIKSCDADKFTAWIFTVASNAFRDFLRRRKNEFSCDEDFWENVRDQRRIESIESQDIFQELDKLSEDTREMILMRFYSGLSFSEIARINGLPIGTVLSKIHRGINKIKEHINIDEYDYR